MTTSLRFFVIIILFKLFSATFASAQQPGSIDSSFNPDDIGFGYGSHAGSMALAIQPDNKVLAFGKLNLRMHEYGTYDSTFAQSTFNTRSIALQTDGKVVVGGWFNQFGGSLFNYIL